MPACPVRDAKTLMGERTVADRGTERKRNIEERDRSRHSQSKKKKRNMKTEEEERAYLATYSYGQVRLHQERTGAV